MCHDTTIFFTVCAHSMKDSSVKCEKGLSWKSRLAVDRCAVMRVAELVRGWCAECEAVFRADGIASAEVEDFNPRSADFISRYWAFKSQAGWYTPTDATAFPRGLVGRRDEIVPNTLNGTRYEIFTLRREVEAYGADRIYIEKLFNCVAAGPADFPAILQKARRLTLEWGMLGGMDDPAFPRDGQVVDSDAEDE